MLLAFLVSSAPSFSQPAPAASPTPAAPASPVAPATPAATPSPAASPTASPTAQPSPGPTEKPATDKPAGDTPSPDPSATPSIEDLYAPDLPKKNTDKTAPPATEESKSKEPIIYISDSDNSRIVVMQGIEGEGFTAVGLPGYGLGRFLRPAQIWLDYAARLYIADSGNNRIVRIDQAANPGWTEVGGLSDPHGVAVDGSGVYVSDTRADRVVIYDSIEKDSKIREVLTHPQLKRPGELWIDAQGALYICCGEDPPGGRLLKTWMEKGMPEKEGAEPKSTRRWAVFGGEGLSGSRFLPSSVVTDKAGLKMLDSSGQRMVSMQDMAGKRLKEEKFRVDPRFRLSRPTGMAISETGRVYIADSGNDRILELGKDGSVVGEFYILDDDSGTLLSNPTSIFIYTPSPAPPPKAESDDDKKGKGKGKGKAKPKEKPKQSDEDLEFESDF